jgi:hypothetical protein
VHDGGVHSYAHLAALVPLHTQLSCLQLPHVCVGGILPHAHGERGGVPGGQRGHLPAHVDTHDGQVSTHNGMSDLLSSANLQHIAFFWTSVLGNDCHR